MLRSDQQGPCRPWPSPGPVELLGASCSRCVAVGSRGTGRPRRAHRSAPTARGAPRLPRHQSPIGAGYRHAGERPAPDWQSPLRSPECAAAASPRRSRPVRPRRLSPAPVRPCRVRAGHQRSPGPGKAQRIGRCCRTASRVDRDRDSHRPVTAAQIQWASSGSAQQRHCAALAGDLAHRAAHV